MQVERSQPPLAPEPSPPNGLSPEAVPRLRAFAASGVTTVSWFPVARSKKVKPGRVARAEAPGGPLALWRSANGAIHAVDSRCPHLGADLSQGTVRDGALVCPFHGWAFGASGACLSAPGWDAPPTRHARSVPVQERWGLVWAANAPEVPFVLPEPPPGRWRVVLPPPQTIRAHAHLIIGNGLDVSHFDALHGMEPLAEPVLRVAAPEVSLEMVGRPRSNALRRVIGGDVRLRFTTIGGHLATVDVVAPIRFRALFSATPISVPDAPEASRTQIVLFLPRGPVQTLRAAVGLYSLLHDDARVLERLRFRRAFTPHDAPLAAFAEIVDALPRGRS